MKSVESYRCITNFVAAAQAGIKAYLDAIAAGKSDGENFFDEKGRSKLAYEGKIPVEQREYVDEALADFHVNKSKEIIEAKRIKRGQEVDRETERIREAHYKNRLSGIYNCADSGRKYPYTISQYYDQKEKLYGPSNDVLLADRIRRGKKIDTSFHLTGKPYRGDYEDEETKEIFAFN